MRQGFVILERGAPAFVIRGRCNGYEGAPVFMSEGAATRYMSATDALRYQVVEIELPREWVLDVDDSKMHLLGFGFLLSDSVLVGSTALEN